MEGYSTSYDITTSEVLEDCAFKPTCVTKAQFPWIYVQNNKYGHNSVHTNKIGKWMLFVPKQYIDDLWDKIKAAVQSGNLWHCKVSTSSPSDKVHAVMIYTKDYTDLDDVINVLNYLEQSDIKRPESVIHYKTDEMTYAGIYAGGKRKASIYSSNTIRTLTSPLDTS